MSDTPRTDAAITWGLCESWSEYHRRQRSEIAAMERECNQLRAALEAVNITFPDMAEFQDKDGQSLDWLAKQIEQALKKEKA